MGQAWPLLGPAAVRRGADPDLPTALLVVSASSLSITAPARQSANLVAGSGRPMTITGPAPSGGGPQAANALWPLNTGRAKPYHSSAPASP